MCGRCYLLMRMRPRHDQLRLMRGEILEFLLLKLDADQNRCNVLKPQFTLNRAWRKARPEHGYRYYPVKWHWATHCPGCVHSGPCTITTGSLPAIVLHCHMHCNFVSAGRAWECSVRSATSERQLWWSYWCAECKLKACIEAVLAVPGRLCRAYSWQCVAGVHSVIYAEVWCSDMMSISHTATKLGHPPIAC